MLLMRSHNEGSLFQRKSGAGKGRWVALVTMRDGRRVSRWAKDRDAAKVELAELLRLRDAGAPMTGRIRLGAYLERWISHDHGWAPATHRKHESICRVHVVPAIGHIRMSEMSVGDVDRLVGSVGVGPRSASHVRATLRRALADAQRDGLLARNPAALSRPVKQPHTERTILDAAQARLLIESTRDTRYGPLWTILVTTGLRISEALGLAWSSVDFGGNDDARVRGMGVRAHDGDRGDARLDRMRDTPDGNVSHRSARGVHGAAHVGPSITVRHQLARENGEWVRRQPKTAKGRRTIPLTPLGVERLGFDDLLTIGEELLLHYPPDTIVCSHSVKADIGAQTAAAIADVIASCRAALSESRGMPPTNSRRPLGDRCVECN